MKLLSPLYLSLPARVWRQGRDRFPRSSLFGGVLGKGSSGKVCIGKLAGSGGLRSFTAISVHPGEVARDPVLEYPFAPAFLTNVADLLPHTYRRAAVPPDL